MSKFPNIDGFDRILNTFYDHIKTNQTQLKVIFWVIILTAITGLLLICIPGLGFFKSADSPVNVISLISGGGLEVISAGSLVVYRLTMKQGQNFMIMIERINAVIMAVHILNTIEEDQKTKNEYAAKMAERLLYSYDFAATQKK
jgi:SNF family Na+-dependent transporter